MRKGEGNCEELGDEEQAATEDEPVGASPTLAHEAAAAGIVDYLVAEAFPPAIRCRFLAEVQGLDWSRAARGP